MTITSPRLLVSVRSLDEALLAYDAGADIIDLKEPLKGSLGAVDAEVMNAVVGHPKLAKTQVTIALGEAIDSPPRPNLMTHPLLYKLGTAGLNDDPNAGARILETARAWGAEVDRPILLPAAYADAERTRSPHWRRVLDWALDAKSPYFLVDTGMKDGSNFFDWIAPEEYIELRAATRASAIPLAVAGSLDEEAIEKLLCDPPEVIAVRGAACEGHRRSGALSSKKVNALVELLKHVRAR